MRENPAALFRPVHFAPGLHADGWFYLPDFSIWKNLRNLSASFTPQLTNLLERSRSLLVSVCVIVDNIFEGCAELLDFIERNCRMQRDI